MSLGNFGRWIRDVTGRAHAERLAAAKHDPWQRFDLEPPLRAFGPGATQEFARYLERCSRVNVETPYDVARWLMECRYADDALLLDDPDHWLHPATFEIVRSGDCEDYSLWAWRKLLEGSYDADFVVGVRLAADGTRGRHAWVLFRQLDREFLFDGVERTVERIIRPVDEVRALYEPQVGATRGGRRFVFAGLFREEWGRRLKLKRASQDVLADAESGR